MLPIYYGHLFVIRRLNTVFGFKESTICFCVRDDWTVTVLNNFIFLFLFLPLVGQRLGGYCLSLGSLHGVRARLRLKFGGSF